MAYTVSNMMPLGTKAPDFKLLDTISGKQISLSDISSDKGTVIIFSCNHCPFVHFVNDEMVRIAKDYQAKGVGFAAISSNDVAYHSEDSPERMAIFAAQSGYTFPYLYDATQEVARAYDAACTPDFYLFDGQMQLVYRGQMDAARPSNGKTITGADLRAAIDAVLNQEIISSIQYPSGGCGIKWKE
jgi:peroxiredoxin